ncbi:MAG: creatininase family protein [Anaerolineales bacterium]|nr:creatininase family protein [Anaerolineales bacterium]
MRFEELNWFDIENYLKKEDRLIFVMGACEQHGYLSVTADVKIPQALADAASQKTGVLVAPSVNFGCSPYFLDYPGTLSLRATTFLDLTEDLLRSVYRQGFRRFVFLNGHGGNNLAMTRLYELQNELPGMQIKWYSWWISNSAQMVAQKYEIRPSHANWLEAFAFTRVCDLPKEEKTPPIVPGLCGAKQTKALYGDGSFGGLYQVDEQIMQELFEVCLKDIIQLLEFDD